MDAHALLSSQGWRGKGHSLHKTDDGIGLAKPLLISRKDNTKGLGQKQHFTSDQWWMNAFDEQLKGLDTSKEGKVVQTITTGKLNAIEHGALGKYSLYASFVRGGQLEGTLSMRTGKEESTSDSDSDEKETQVPETQQSGPTTETKEERRLRRDAKRKRKEQRALEKAARRERKSKLKKADTSDSDDEKRKRRARKEEKRRRRNDQGSKSKED